MTDVTQGDLPTLFLAIEIGPDGSPQRRRANDVFDEIVSPVAKELSLCAIRADRDATPGSISSKMVKDITECTVFVGDLTGRNPNVFYELAIAHSFSRPTVVMADKGSSSPFDVKDERLVILGDLSEKLGVGEMRLAQSALMAQLEIALKPGYLPKSPVSEAATARSLDELGSHDPVAAELSTIRDQLAGLDRVMRILAVERDDRRRFNDLSGPGYHSVPATILEIVLTNFDHLTNGQIMFLQKYLQDVRPHRSPRARDIQMTLTHLVNERYSEPVSSDSRERRPGPPPLEISDDV